MLINSIALLHNGINFINSNKYIYAILMILLNLGSRYIDIDFSENHRAFLSSKLLRRLIIFTIAFIATRDFVVSLIITCIFIIIFLNLFNENSKYCIISKSIRDIDRNNDGEISPKEIEYAYRILKKAGKI